MPASSIAPRARRAIAAAGLVLLAAALAHGAFATRTDARVIMRPPPPSFDPRVEGDVVSRDDGPPPISGGTMAVIGEDRVAVSDPDRDRVLVVDLGAGRVIARVALPRGAEPGRVVGDTEGRVHAVLRGTGEVLSFAVATPRASRRRSVCPMPRGLAFDAARDELVVACRGGELVSLPAGEGGVRATRRLERDLRDVVVAGGRTYVTRFRSAEVIVLEGEGARRLEAAEAAGETLGGLRSRRRPAPPAESALPFENAVAWRARALPDGALAVLHQRHSRDEVSTSIGGYGQRTFGCRAVVKSALSRFGAGAPVLGPDVNDVPLPVDFAFRAGADGALAELVVVSAGKQDGNRSVVRWTEPDLAREGCVQGEGLTLGREPIRNAIAVEMVGERIVVQQRDPARLVLLGEGEPRTIPLGGGAAFDTGHAIFHTGTAAGIACASCHPEGGEDGHVWHFRGAGPRRTPALHAVAGAAPFHWEGDMADMTALMNEVFGRRMGARQIGAGHPEAMERWLGHVRAPRTSASDVEAIARGRAIFEGDGGCTDCHDGPRLSNGESRDVGTGRAFQVPSLIGVADRLPVMHDGCADTLEARFDPECGGDRHGPALDDASRRDLIVYLESL